MKLLGIDTNAKTRKGQKEGWMTGITYLAPSNESGVMNTCAHASPGCREACLFTAGRGAMPSVKNARVNKTLHFYRNRDKFMSQLIDEVAALVRKAKRKGFKACVRLNGTSDLPWENITYQGKNIFQYFPFVQFYDYTKNPKRMFSWIMGNLPANYHLTFSRSETNDADVKRVLDAGGNVAVVFRSLPVTYQGKRVVDGDATDLRFLDGENVVVGLKAKGKAKGDKMGFVVDDSAI